MHKAGILFFCLSLACLTSTCQDRTTTNDISTIARKMMARAGKCALITVGTSGYPSVRMMDPMLPQEDFVVWMATNPKSRKVTEIRENSQATLYYADDSSQGYVSLVGHAYIIEDEEAKEKYWKQEWTPFYPDKNDGLVLIRFEPLKIELVSYKDGIISEQSTWEAPFVVLPKGGSD